MCSLPENLSVNWAHECVYKYCITKHTLNVITQLHSYSGPFLYLTVRKILCWTQASGSYIGGCCVLLVPCFFFCSALMGEVSGFSYLTCRKQWQNARLCKAVHKSPLQVENVDQQFRSADEAVLFSSPEAASRHPSLLFCDAHGVVNKESPRRKERLISNRYCLLKWHVL